MCIVIIVQTYIHVFGAACHLVDYIASRVENDAVDALVAKV